MGNKLPVIHEISTSFASLGDAIVGNPARARQRWNDYANESVLGSGIYAAALALDGQLEEARMVGKGMGRATGSAVLGGGLLRNVPGFQELAVCGDMLGECMAGEPEKAPKHVELYAENSVIGSFEVAVINEINGDDETAAEYYKKSGKAALSAGVTCSAIGWTVFTGGLAAPLGVASAATAGAITGASSAALTTSVDALIYDRDISENAGDLVGGCLMGASMGAVSGALQARAYARAEAMLEAAEGQLDVSEAQLEKAEMQAQRLENASQKALNEKLYMERQSNTLCELPDKAVYSEMHCSDGEVYAGVNSKCRPQGMNKLQDNRLKEMAKIVKEMAPEANNVIKRPVHTCAEAQAFSLSPHEAIPVENYTVGVAECDVDGTMVRQAVVRTPCGNCQRASDIGIYGVTPFANAQYDNMPVSEAIGRHLDPLKGCVNQAQGDLATSVQMGNELKTTSTMLATVAAATGPSKGEQS